MARRRADFEPRTIADAQWRVAPAREWLLKIAIRLNLLSLVTILVMTAGVVVAGVFILEAALRQSHERLMRLELQNVIQAI